MKVQDFINLVKGNKISFVDVYEYIVVNFDDNDIDKLIDVFKKCYSESTNKLLLYQFLRIPVLRNRILMDSDIFMFSEEEFYEEERSISRLGRQRDIIQIMYLNQRLKFRNEVVVPFLMSVLPLVEYVSKDFLKESLINYSHRQCQLDLFLSDKKSRENLEKSKVLDKILITKIK